MAAFIGGALIGITAGMVIRHVADDQIEGALGQQEEYEAYAENFSQFACGHLTTEQCDGNKFCRNIKDDEDSSYVVCQGQVDKDSNKGGEGYFCGAFDKELCPATQTSLMTLTGIPSLCKLENDICLPNL